jgi:hypothetical protein
MNMYEIKDRQLTNRCDRVRSNPRRGRTAIEKAIDFYYYASSRFYMRFYRFNRFSIMVSHIHAGADRLWFVSRPVSAVQHIRIMTRAHYHLSYELSLVARAAKGYVYVFSGNLKLSCGHSSNVPSVFVIPPDARLVHRTKQHHRGPCSSSRRSRASTQKFSWQTDRYRVPRHSWSRAGSRGDYYF